MVNNKSFEKAIELIVKSNSILITTHIRPDGDASDKTIYFKKFTGLVYIAIIYLNKYE